MSRSIRGGRHRATRRRRRGRGQTLVEFALVLPLFMLILMGVLEFGFLFNSYLAINFASREASLVGAEAGTAGQADCLILDAIERSVSAPSNRAQISQVQIYRADRAGKKTADITTYDRSGSTLCDLPGGGTLSVPYKVAGSAKYPPSNRCNRLAGCALTPTSPKDLDQIGIEVTYSYVWRTPIGNIFGGSEGTTTLIEGNVMRMEPVL